MISELTLRFGSASEADPLVIPGAALNVVVGPNNSGKSLLMGEIASFLLGGPGRNTQHLKMLRSIHPRTWTEEEFRSYLQKWSKTDSNGEEYFAVQDSQGSVIEIPACNLNAYFSGASSDLALGEVLWQLLSVFLDGSTRLTILNQVRVESYVAPRRGPLLNLFRDDGARAKLSSLCYSVFGVHFLVDPTTPGSIRAAYSGIQSPSVAVERGVTEEALAFHASPEANLDVSDGVRAFAGIMAALLGHAAAIVVIDEPEAFLHPALSRRLAFELGRVVQERQGHAFIATHSSSFLLGAISSGAPCSVIRLTYALGTPTARLLDPTDLTTFAREPLLRSIGALEALFHQAVVVCEADSDRCFYQEINHRLFAAGQRHVQDAMFLNAQNWMTIHRVIGPLRKLGIAAAAIVDFDMIGGDGASFQRLLEAANVPQGTRKSLGQLKGEVSRTLATCGGEWKARGIDSLPSNCRPDAENLLRQLGDYGVFVVPSGALESWLGELGCRGHSPQWLLDMFEALGSDPTKQSYVRPAAETDVWAFIGLIGEWASNPQRGGM